MTKLYTGQGDGGESFGLDGVKRLKCDPVLEAIGAVDELNAHLGWCMAAIPDDPRIGGILDRAQRDLMAAGASLSADAPGGRHAFPSEAIGRAETWIDEVWSELPPLNALLLPRGAEAASRLHVARAVCRRAERRVVALMAPRAVPSDVLVYLNRLGDLLFAMARAVNRACGTPERRWDTPP